MADGWIQPAWATHLAVVRFRTADEGGRRNWEDLDHAPLADDVDRSRNVPRLRYAAPARVDRHPDTVDDETGLAQWTLLAEFLPDAEGRVPEGRVQLAGVGWLADEADDGWLDYRGKPDPVVFHWEEGGGVSADGVAVARLDEADVRTLRDRGGEAFLAYRQMVEQIADRQTREEGEGAT